MKILATSTKLFDLNRSKNLSQGLTLQGSMAGIFSQEEFHSILIREKARADRNGHGFSLVAIEVDQQADIDFFVKNFQKKIRKSDEIGWFDYNTLGILLYNTTALGAWQFVNKNKIGIDDGSGVFKWLVYSYPTDWCAI
jgi:hypothetical protein